MTDTATTAAGAAHGADSFPMSRDMRCPFDPPPGMLNLLQDAPISRLEIWDGSRPWVIMRHADQHALLGDPRVSANWLDPGFPHRTEGSKARFEQFVTFMHRDGEAHRQGRGMVTSVVAIKYVESLRGRMQELTDQLLDQMLAGPKPVDFIQAFALPLPSLVMCELLGVPYEDHGTFQETTACIMNYKSAPDEMIAATDRLADYLEGLIVAKRDEPGDDLLTKLAHNQVATGQLTTREAATLSVLLLTAGHETTANVIALGTLALLQRPEQVAELRETDDRKLIAGTVEEILRYLTISHAGRRRVALEDNGIGGQVIRAGDGIIFASDVANRDPGVFPSPHDLDIHRDARRHVAFGYGPHQCLGQPLARVELQVAFATIFRRIPTLSLATDIDNLRFKTDGVSYGVYELPITW